MDRHQHAKEEGAEKGDIHHGLNQSSLLILSFSFRIHVEQFYGPQATTSSTGAIVLIVCRINALHTLMWSHNDNIELEEQLATV